jgi:hypothetical protein
LLFFPFGGCFSFHTHSLVREITERPQGGPPFFVRTHSFLSPPTLFFFLLLCTTFLISYLPQPPTPNISNFPSLGCKWSVLIEFNCTSFPFLFFCRPRLYPSRLISPQLAMHIKIPHMMTCRPSLASDHALAYGMERKLPRQGRVATSKRGHRDFCNKKHTASIGYLGELYEKENQPLISI